MIVTRWGADDWLSYTSAKSASVSLRGKSRIAVGAPGRTAFNCSSGFAVSIRPAETDVIAMPLTCRGALEKSGTSRLCVRVPTPPPFISFAPIRSDSGPEES